MALLKRIVHEIKPITKTEAINDYIKLQLIPCYKIKDSSLIGNTAADFFFFKYRIKTLGNKGISFYDLIKNIDDYINNKNFKSLERYYDNTISEYKLYYTYYRLYYGSVSQFKAIIAKKLYCKFKADKILDFSAGWGGRCLAAMSLNLNYTGIDSNILLKKPYEAMIKTYQHDSQINMIFKDSSKIDYSKLDYNFVFTSPPYYNTQLIETYEKMPLYKSKEDFNENFFFKVVKNSYDNMKNGTYILNIPDYMYVDIKQILGPSDKKKLLYINKRNNNYKEYIYIWFKKNYVAPPVKP